MSLRNYKSKKTDLLKKRKEKRALRRFQDKLVSQRKKTAQEAARADEVQRTLAKVTASIRAVAKNSACLPAERIMLNNDPPIGGYEVTTFDRRRARFSEVPENPCLFEVLENPYMSGALQRLALHYVNALTYCDSFNAQMQKVQHVILYWGNKRFKWRMAATQEALDMARGLPFIIETVHDEVDRAFYEDAFAGSV